MKPSAFIEFCWVSIAWLMIFWGLLVGIDKAYNAKQPKVASPGLQNEKGTRTEALGALDWVEPYK